MSKFLDELKFQVNEQNLPVRAEQLATRLKLYPTTVWTTVIVELFFVWGMWNDSSHRVLLIWLVSASLIHIASLSGLAAYKNSPPDIEHCQALSRRFILFSLAVGLIWGFGVFYLYPHDLLMQVFVISVMLGLAAGATVMNPTHLPSLFLYVLSMMLPLAFRLLIDQDETHLALGLLLLLFVVVMLISGQFMSRLILIYLQQRLEKMALSEKLSDMNENLELKVRERTEELLRKKEELGQIQDVTIIAMGALAEARDSETGNHLKRTQRYIKALALQLKDHPQFRAFLTNDNIEMLFKLAPLHDIGKVGIPDYILLKNGKLSEEEFEIMKTHTTLASDALASAESNLAAPSRFLHMGREIAAGHHEHWDGSGYPKGLSGINIPISARLMAIADVYDALISKRIYKQPYQHQDAVDFIRNGRGTHFDPVATDAFLEIQDEFQHISERFKD